MLTGDAIWDGIGTMLIGALLGVIAVILMIEMHSLLIGEGATADDPGVQSEPMASVSVAPLREADGSLSGVLLRIAPTPVIELNHAAAVAMVDGPARALDLVEAVAARGGLADYHLLPAARAMKAHDFSPSKPMPASRGNRSLTTYTS